MYTRVQLHTQAYTCTRTKYASSHNAGDPAVYDVLYRIYCIKIDVDTNLDFEIER